MIIRGYQRTTLVDYPEQIAATIFTGGCNFRCGYCYNAPLVHNDASLPLLKEEIVLADLALRKRYVDAVVITGGEPTLHNDLIDFIERLKQHHFLVKLDTNGTNPEMIKQLLDKRLVDYIAMDIKTILGAYKEVIDVNMDMKRIQETIHLLLNSTIPYEFRTTLIKGIHTKEKLKEMAKQIQGAKKYYLQPFVLHKDCIDKSLSEKNVFSKEECQEFAELCNQYVKTELR